MKRPETAQETFLYQHQQYKRKIHFLRIFIFVVFLVLWELAADLSWINDFIFSSPKRLVTCFFQMLMEGTIWQHVSITLLETMISFVLVILFTILIAVLLWAKKSVSDVSEPYMVVLNSLPKSALAPLLIVWLGANRTTIIVAGMSVAIFGSILSLYTSFISVDPEKIKLIYTLHGTKFHALTKVVLPASLPAIINIMKVNIGLCLVGVIIGEFLAARSGLGYLIIYSSQVFKMDHLLMSICLLCLMAMLLYALINALEKWYLACQHR